MTEIVSAGLGFAHTALRATSLCVRYWLGGNVIGATQAWLVTGDLSYLGHAEVTSARWDRDTAVRAAVPHSSGIYTCFSVLCTRLRVRVRSVSRVVGHQATQQALHRQQTRTWVRRRNGCREVAGRVLCLRHHANRLGWSASHLDLATCQWRVSQRDSFAPPVLTASQGASASLEAFDSFAARQCASPSQAVEHKKQTITRIVTDQRDCHCGAYRGHFLDGGAKCDTSTRRARSRFAAARCGRRGRAAPRAPVQVSREHIFEAMKFPTVCATKLESGKPRLGAAPQAGASHILSAASLLAPAAPARAKGSVTS